MRMLSLQGLAKSGIIFSVLTGSVLVGSVLPDSAIAADAENVNRDDAQVGALVQARAIRLAVRNVEIARLNLRQYVRTEYPLRLRQFNSEIKISEAEIRLLRKRIAAYRNVSHGDRNAYSSPTTVNVKKMKIALVAGEFDLERMKSERTLLIDNDRSRRRMYKLELEAAIEELDFLRPKTPEPKAIRNHRNTA